MKKSLHWYLGQYIVMFFACYFFCSFSGDAFAEIEWEILKTLTLDEKPQDIALSFDGQKAYVLGSKNIMIYSIGRGEVIDKIPIKKKFSQINVSPDGEHLYLTDTKAKKISIIEISTIYDIEIGQSPIIGQENAPVHAFLFLDYQ